MSNENKSSENGLLLGLLTICFVVLKLTNIIAWSWLWVLAPVWIPIGIYLIIIIIACIIGVVMKYSEGNK